MQVSTFIQTNKMDFIQKIIKVICTLLLDWMQVMFTYYLFTYFICINMIILINTI
jgi:hypothetical protein